MVDPGWQIRIRAKDYDTAEIKSRAVIKALDRETTLVNVTVSGSVYRIWSVDRDGDPLHLGQEPNSDREIIVINGIMAVDQVS